MSGIRSLYRGATVLGFAAGTSAPIYVNTTSNKLKFIPAGTGTTEIEILDTAGPLPISVTAATVTLGPTHIGRTTVLNLAAGIAVTLPAATGSGAKYRLVIGITFTGASTVKVPNATDYMIGVAQMGIDGGTAVPHQYPTANTGTVATESDTIDMFGTSNSTGGIKGQVIELEDIASAVWSVLVRGDAGGTEATPFSAGV